MQQHEKELAVSPIKETKLPLFERPKDETLPMTLLCQAVEALLLNYFSLPDQDRMICATVQAIKEMEPKDAAEGMLIAQMVATHNATMECFRMGVDKNLSAEQKTNYINNANKLIRTYTMLQDSLQRYRGKSHYEQKITVQHINVSDGGQAIVGDINKPQNNR